MMRVTSSRDIGGDLSFVDAVAAALDAEAGASVDTAFVATTPNTPINMQKHVVRNLFIDILKVDVLC
ncbi:MAG: hypothetical protein WA777_06410 [Rhodanobacter sp.]